MTQSLKKNLTIKIEGINSFGLGFMSEIYNSSPHTFLIPYVLPDEKVLARADKKIKKNVYCSMIDVKKISNQRVPSECNHFRTCGNCLLQHWNYKNYYEWKHNLIKTPIKNFSPNSKVFDMISVPKFSRRRAKFFTSINENKNIVGFKKYRSNNLFNINDCIVLDPQILEFMKVFRSELNKIRLFSKKIIIKVNKLDYGLDILIHFEDLLQRNLLKNIFYKDLNVKIARVHFQYKNYTPELILSINKNKLTINEEVYSLIPPGSFFQPTKFTENQLIKFLIEEINSKNKLKILDLFSGSGTFTLPLASKNQKVFAIDIDQNSIKSLVQASKEQNLFSNIQSNLNNLMKNELEDYFLKKFDMVILDPPRSGSLLQISKISSLKIKKIIYISCNIKTFLRDAKILISSGYHLVIVKPIDQFLYTYHMEIFSVFEFNN